jgi:dTDP-4-dehydrorhamnose reductase
MKILLTGASGQVGHELALCLRPCGEIFAPDRSLLDLERPEQLRQVIRAFKPDVIVNPAAYTAVDQAESEAATALRVNAEAPAVIGEEARRNGAAIVHFSTDYVFDGRKFAPYEEDDEAAPINVYGRTKLAGEQALQAADVPCLLLRTGWVYGLHGRNFMLSVLRMARERDTLRIVGDQYGAPTWSRTVAQACAQLLARAGRAVDRDEWWRRHRGVYHLSARGRTSWHGFASAIVERARLARTPLIQSISTEEYPTPASRPRYSVLSCAKLEREFGLRTPHWEQGLAACLGSAGS